MIAEVSPPGSETKVDTVRLRRGGQVTGWLTWASVFACDIGALAGRCGFPLVERWSAAGRWFAALS